MSTLSTNNLKNPNSSSNNIVLNADGTTAITSLNFTQDGIGAVARTVNSKLKDVVSVKDFGAVGDGVANDTAAINRALYELFCREVNAEVRRSLYFPAGTYLIDDTILIPPYAKIWGEGMNSTVIKLESGSGATYLARTTDSLQQTGINIGTNSAVTPRNVEISAITLEAMEITDIFLVESIDQMYFGVNKYHFQGLYP